MAKIKLTKGELKRQRDSLSQFRHYLPTLLLKKQQLQMKIQENQRELKKQEGALREKESSLKSWVGLLGDPQAGKIPALASKDQGSTEYELKHWLMPESIDLEQQNIAGVNLPVLKGVEFSDTAYDLYATPFWLDRGIEDLQALIRLRVEMDILNERIRRLAQELRVTTQRVNLFEKIKIPECLDHIRRIRIYLGDMQANAVGISKVAKKKLEVAALAEA